jgi:hypothetical protein
VDLRAGQDWDEALLRMIDAADVFQLFWSTNAMRSTAVRREYEYALSLGRREFVRPTYWQEPLPRDEASDLPPQDLLRLHFQRIAVADPPAEPKKDATQIVAIPQLGDPGAWPPPPATARPPAPADSTPRVEAPPAMLAREPASSPRAAPAPVDRPLARSARATGTRWLPLLLGLLVGLLAIATLLASLFVGAPR